MEKPENLKTKKVMKIDFFPFFIFSPFYYWLLGIKIGVFRIFCILVLEGTPLSALRTPHIHRTHKDRLLSFCRCLRLKLHIRHKNGSRTEPTIIRYFICFM